MNYWSFSRILLYWKCISENKKKEKKPILPDWAELVGPTQPAPAQQSARTGPSELDLGHRPRPPRRRRRRSWYERSGFLGGPRCYLTRARAPAAARVACALVRRRLRKALPPVSTSPSPPTICRFHRPSSRASTTRSSRPSRCTSSTPHRHLLSAGAPPPLADQAGRHGWPLPAISPSSSVQGEGSIAFPLSSSSFSLTYVSTWQPRTPAPLPSQAAQSSCPPVYRGGRRPVLHETPWAKVNFLDLFLVSCNSFM
jgi:hypothetical protein